MQLRNPKELKKWSQNPKTQTKEQYARMLERYKEYGQLTAFLVMPDGTILGGNHGLQAVIELDMQAKCIPVDFVQEGDEWFFVNDGEIQRQVPYKSKEEGMIKVSTAHNERFSQYDPDALANLIGNYHIDMPDYSFDFMAQMTLGALGQQNINENKEIDTNILGNDLDCTCPKCGFKFKKNEQSA